MLYKLSHQLMLTPYPNTPQIMSDSNVRWKVSLNTLKRLDSVMTQWKQLPSKTHDIPNVYTEPFISLPQKKRQQLQPFEPSKNLDAFQRIQSLSNNKRNTSTCELDNTRFRFD